MTRNEEILREALERAKTDLEIANETEGFMLDCSYIDDALKATEPQEKCDVCEGDGTEEGDRMTYDGQVVDCEKPCHWCNGTGVKP